MHIRANSLEDPWLFGSPLAGTAAKPQQRALQCPSFAAADAPGVAGACLHQGEAQPVHLVYQRVHCASVLHTRCPVFQGSENAPWQPETPTRVRYPRHRVWLGAIVVLALAVIGAVISLRPAGESEDFISRLPASRTTPLAVVTPDVVAVPLSLEPIPTPPPLDVRAAPPTPAAPPQEVPAAPATLETDVQWQQTVEAALQPLVALQNEPAPLSPPEAEFSGTTLETWPEVVLIEIALHDTLKAIAARFETTVDALTTLNALDPAAILRIGQELRVPIGFDAPAE